jgi:minimal PKS acyl carrier protein
VSAAIGKTEDHMQELTLNELRTVMRGCVGADDTVDLDGDIAEVPFDGLGYDSLAVLEIVVSLQDTWQVHIPDEAIDELRTPAALIDYVNQRHDAAREQDQAGSR